MSEKKESQIAIRRKLLGMTQKQLAKLTGLPQSRISEYESGAFSTMSMTIRTAKKIADALGCTIGDLMLDKE